MEDRERVRAALRDQGVTGAEDLGRFVNDVANFRPSELDERSAMPVLLGLRPLCRMPEWWRRSPVTCGDRHQGDPIGTAAIREIRKAGKATR